MSVSSLAYVSFDQVPAPKGSAIHIQAFARALGLAFGPVSLLTVAPGYEAQPAFERWPGVRHASFPATGPTLIDRVLEFRRQTAEALKGRQAIHFRSIYEGFPLLRLRPRPRLVFEVNGLPSIELKYRYPRLLEDRELRDKIHAQEQSCLLAADLVVTPSNVTAGYLASRGVLRSRIQVIPNGVDLSLFPLAPEPPAEGAPYSLVYFGTMAGWQGIELAIRATAMLQQSMPAELALIGTRTRRQQEAIGALIAKLQANVVLLDPMPQEELACRLRRASAVLAPLTRNDRNTLQGCCPLKVLEGMASGAPVIVSDLPVVRELGEHEVHFLAVKPGSVEEIAGAVLRLRSDPALAQRLSRAARQRIEDRYQWRHAAESLVGAYHQYGIMRSSTA